MPWKECHVEDKVSVGGLPISDEMTLGKGATRARLQIFLEAKRVLFGCELHRNDKCPRAIWRCVQRAARIMRCESPDDVGCDSHVRALVAFTSKHIDEALLIHSHVAGNSKETAGRFPSEMSTAD